MDRFKLGLIFLAVFVGGLMLPSLTGATGSTLEGGYGEGPLGSDPVVPETPALLSLVLRTTGSIALVIALVFVFVYTMRKFLYARRYRGSREGLINVIGSSFLQPKKAIYVVRVMDRILVLGVTDARISLLCELSDVSAWGSSGISGEANESNSSRQFSEYLGSLLGKIRK